MVFSWSSWISIWLGAVLFVNLMQQQPPKNNKDFTIIEVRWESALTVTTTTIWNLHIGLSWCENISLDDNWYLFKEMHTFYKLKFVCQCLNVMVKYTSSKMWHLIKPEIGKKRLALQSRPYLILNLNFISPSKSSTTNAFLSKITLAWIFTKTTKIIVCGNTHLINCFSSCQSEQQASPNLAFCFQIWNKRSLTVI